MIATVGKPDTKNLQSEIEKSRVELNALQKKIKSIIEKRPARTAMAKEAQAGLNERARNSKSK